MWGVWRYIGKCKGDCNMSKIISDSDVELLSKINWFEYYNVGWLWHWAPKFCTMNIYKRALKSEIDFSSPDRVIIGNFVIFIHIKTKPSHSCCKMLKTWLVSFTPDTKTKFCWFYQQHTWTSSFEKCCSRISSTVCWRRSQSCEWQHNR